MTAAWHQLNVAFPDWPSAEKAALTHLIPQLTDSEHAGTIQRWFFLRKSPCWRIRYQPGNTSVDDKLTNALTPLLHSGHITDATTVIYEPETHAFGGEAAMHTAHRLFHLDSRHLLTHLTRHPAPRHRRELSILLCTAMLRAAQLDWYEQGDVWARVADHRDPPEPIPEPHRQKLRAGLHHLLSADVSSLTLTVRASWPAAFADAGSELASLASTGRLHRGLRAVLAHHILFHWNRLGITPASQATLARAARAVTMGN